LQRAETSTAPGAAPVDRPGRRFVAAFLVATLAAICALTGFIAWCDPYWLWRERPPWRYGLAIDLRTRLAKAGQLVTRGEEVVLIGSSIVYRGLDPATLAVPAYNAGISALRIAEARALLAHALVTHRRSTVVLGLDFYMFDDARRQEPDFDRDLGGPAGIVGIARRAFASLGALEDCLRALIRDADAGFDGTWERNGYKATTPRSAREVATYLAQGEEVYRGITPGDTGEADLEAMLALARRNGVDLKLYLSPTHRRFRDMLARLGEESAFRAWRGRMHAVAARAGVPILDLTAITGIAATPLDGSDDGFLDATHVTPQVGAAILARLGLPVRLPQGALPALPERAVDHP
jgi:hypothetical protein